MRRPIRRWTGASLALLAAAPLLAAAGDISRFRNPMVSDGLLSVSSTDALPPLHYNVALGSGYSFNTLVWRYPDGTYTPVIEHQVTGEVVATMGIIRFIDVGVALPMLLFQDGPGPPSETSDLIDIGDIRGSGLGDLRLLTRVQFADERTFGFGGAFINEFTFPTGELGGRQRYFGDPGVAWRPQLVGSFPVGPARIIGAMGLRIRNTELISGADAAIQHEMEWNLGSEVRILEDDVPLAVIAELSIAHSIEGRAGGEIAMEALGGVRTFLASAIRLTAGVGVGLTSGLGTPGVRALVNVAWAPVADDLDGDGVPDANDQCPYDSEDDDDFEDGDGCPEPDNDDDGIPDSDDRCPSTPEDHNGFNDEDGCPDQDEVDTDEDGIPDIIDRCPTDPEDRDGTKDEDGCPDIDNDLDGIPDTDDQCPAEKETINGIDDYDGCPDEGAASTEYTEGKIQIKETILFQSGKAIIKDESTPILDQVALQILSHPDIVKVRIEGHTDDLGDEEDNLFLSQDRADAVRRYLITRGVPKTKLEAVGFGEGMPIAPNDTPTGRTKNRRVEFVILQTVEK